MYPAMSFDDPEVRGAVLGAAVALPSGTGSPGKLDAGREWIRTI
jgi:hypothetical protein